MEEKTGIRTMAAEDPMKVVAVGSGQFAEVTGMRRNSQSGLDFTKNIENNRA